MAAMNRIWNRIARSEASELAEDKFAGLFLIKRSTRKRKEKAR